MKKLDLVILHRTFINVPIERAFTTLTTSQGWNAWFTTYCHLEAHIGGNIYFRWENFGPDLVNAEDSGKVLAFTSPTLFSFTWHPVTGHQTTVTFELQSAYGGTIVQVSDEGYPDSKEGKKMLMDCAAGWGEALTLLKFYLEKGITYTHPRPVQ